MNRERDWPLLTLIGLSSASLVMLAVVIVRAMQQGQAIEALNRRLDRLEQSGGTAARGLEADQLQQLGERVRRLESLGSQLSASEPLVPDLKDPLLPSPLPLTPPRDRQDPAPLPLELPPPPRPGQPERNTLPPGLPLRPPSRGLTP
ncbi:MAG: hypothetical protein VKO00_05275 [Cyanobacteriota bacterium]|nr:hypothetical protein [Cyanobacteriota bacterium]